MNVFNKTATYDESFHELFAKVNELQSDMAAVAGTIGEISAHGLDDARAEAAKRANALLRQSQQFTAGLAHRAVDMEHSVEDTLRRQPLLTAAVAIVLGFLLSLMVRR